MSARVVFVLSIYSVLTACATFSQPSMNESVESPVAQRQVLSEVPFLEQDALQCGPTSLAMVLNHYKDPVTVDGLKEKVFTRSGSGSLQSDMISGARRQGYMAHTVKTFNDVVREVNAGRPVIVFTNQALQWFPQWHYAVVIGYDLNTEKMYLHTGPDRLKEEYYSTFAHQWSLANQWALVVYPAKEDPVTGTELERMNSASMLEAIGNKEQALLAYQSILKKWPTSLGAMIGLGNIYYSTSRLREAAHILARAKELHPQSQVVRHNYEVALNAWREQKKLHPATKSATGM